MLSMLLILGRDDGPVAAGPVWGVTLPPLVRAVRAAGPRRFPRANRIMLRLSRIRHGRHFREDRRAECGAGGELEQYPIWWKHLIGFLALET
jgi:hypothetical protein